MPRTTHFSLPHSRCFSLLSPIIAPKTSVKYLSCCESSPLKHLIHFSAVRLGKRLVSQQIQVSICSKHFTSHCTPSRPGGSNQHQALLTAWLHSPLTRTDILMPPYIFTIVEYEIVHISLAKNNYAMERPSSINILWYFINNYPHFFTHILVFCINSTSGPNCRFHTLNPKGETSLLVKSA